MSSPEKRWQVLWEKIGVPVSPALLDALLAAYREPQRHYHTLQHLLECFAHFDALKALAQHPLEIELSLWFHDSVYDVHARGNEARSAAWADAALSAAGLAPDACVRVHGLIMATCHDALPASKDAQLLVDIDLAILGAAPARFAEYEAQIRAEYAHVPQALFVQERGKILRHFLRRERIYVTPALHDALEAQAHANLIRAIGIDTSS